MINLILASDNNYAPYLSVMLNSILINNKNDFNKFNIFILDDGLSKTSKNKLNEIIKSYNANISFIPTKNLNELEIKMLTIERDITLESLTTYSRLFIATLLPKNIKKAIYIDCDGLIVDSLKEIWETNIDNYYCAAVLDGANPYVRKKLGIESNKNYFNAGFLLINLDKWRKDNVEEKFIKFMINNQHRYYQHDQGTLNYVFKDNVLIIKPKYNLFLFFQFLEYKLAKKYACLTEYYNEEIMTESMKNPVFLHFCGNYADRPWFNKSHPYRKLYEEYAEKVGLKEVIFNNDNDIDLKNKIFYNASKNKGSQLILKIIPTKIIHNILGKNTVAQIEEYNEKAKKL